MDGDGSAKVCPATVSSAPPQKREQRFAGLAGSSSVPVAFQTDQAACLAVRINFMSLSPGLLTGARLSVMCLAIGFD